MSNPSITADKTPWYQWDTWLTVTVSGGAMTECHFANRKQGTAYVQAVINGIARVPDELLQVAAPIKAYGYVSDGSGGQTYVEQTFEVIARNIPADYTYTKTAQKTIRDAEAARDDAVQAAKDAKASELAADDSAVEASNSAQSAGESASAAATSASNAAKSASDAKAAASKTVEDASKLLKTYTDNAKTSADNAATSARNAADAASSASGSASAAEQSATDANSAKVAAQTAKAEAATSASNAATSASSAAESATAAAKSASDAAASVDAINVIAPRHTATSATAENTALAIGNAAHSYGSYSIAIGASSDCGNGSSVAIGDSARTTRDAEFSIGSISGGRYLANVRSPELDTDASTKKYTDDNDAKTLREAKKYTDANTSNALVGSVSGNLLHVEDAWPGKPLGLTIDGAYKQDGTPSPENPVPITVIENPVLMVTGRNLLDFSSLTAGYTIDSSNGSVYKTQSGKWCATLQQIPIPESLEAVTLSGNDTNYQTSLVFYDDDDKFVGNRSIRVTPYTFEPPANSNRMRFTAYDYDYTLKNTMVEVGKGTTYAPYAGASLPITLPAEHPYLAALPNGTHDEIVIDKDGNASLVARVGVDSNVTNIGYVSVGEYYEIVTNLPAFSYVSELVTDTVICSAIPSLDSTNTCIYRTFDTVYVKYTTQETKEELQAKMNKVAPLTVVAAIPPKTYPLGKLDIPALPETISNVWTDAELTTNMSMKYKRDINVAFENLVQEVVASAAGE